MRYEIRGKSKLPVKVHGQDTNDWLIVSTPFLTTAYLIVDALRLALAEEIESGCRDEVEGQETEYYIFDVESDAVLPATGPTFLLTPK